MKGDQFDDLQQGSECYTVLECHDGHALLQSSQHPLPVVATISDRLRGQPPQVGDRVCTRYDRAQGTIVIRDRAGAAAVATLVRAAGMPLLREFNPHHDPQNGRFTFATGARGAAASGAGAGSVAEAGRAVARQTPIKVTTVEEAIGYVLKGQAVELPDPKQANTLLVQLAAMANDAKAKGEKAPNYDLCNVTVAGANNLFCGSKLRSTDYPNGVPRIEMPQFSGIPVPGSAADKLPKNDKGEVNAADAFVAHLTSLGITTSNVKMPAARLKASQAELVGEKVAGMMTSTTYDPGAERIFVSKDHYVIDGHHRWAAVVGRDLKDGTLGDLSMDTVRVNVPITQVLLIAKEWATAFGIAGKGGPSTAKPAPDHRRTFLRRA